MPLKYRINEAPEAQGGYSITCLLCNRTSFNQNDVEQFWCDHCKQFLRDPGDNDSVYNSRQMVKDAIKRSFDDGGLI